jgi:hypothetical protein
MSNDSIMVRLRRANPVPETPAADDSGLFDRITTLPQDAPVSERREGPTRRQRRGLILVLAAVIAALLASTAFAISRWIGGDLVEPPVTRQEYFDAQKQLVLPPGVVWPKPDVAANDNSVTTRGGGGGRAVLIAMNAWECYWVDAIRRGDDAAGQRAHEELKRLLANNVFEAPAGATEDWVPSPFPTVPFATFAHDGGLDWIREGYDRAAAGHPRRIAQSCRANAQDTVPGQ